MLKPVVTASLLVPLFATAAHAETVTATADTLVVVTPNAPVVVNTNGEAQAPAIQPPGAAEMPPAPPAPPAAVNGAPQNEDWNNVSHINGVPVKVGERNDYLYNFKKTNLSVNPFGLFFGYYDISASHALNNNLALSVAITGWSFDSGDEQGFQLTASAPLYFRRTFSGPFLEGGLIIRTTDDEQYYDCYDCSATSSMSNSWVGPELLFGWHWTFDSGFNIAMAAGVAKRMNNNSEYSDGTEANGYFRVGYAF
ncbi:MAG: hypothetical protein HOV81_01995 [Kofleriaceae bacterium]|nr:hypothetical protein [Kofleriaceae bacterium]